MKAPPFEYLNQIFQRHRSVVLEFRLLRPVHIIQFTRLCKWVFGYMQ